MKYVFQPGDRIVLVGERLDKFNGAGGKVIEGLRLRNFKDNEGGVHSLEGYKIHIDGESGTHEVQRHCVTLPTPARMFNGTHMDIVVPWSKVDPEVVKAMKGATK